MVSRSFVIRSLFAVLRKISVFSRALLHPGLGMQRVVCMAAHVATENSRQLSTNRARTVLILTAKARNRFAQRPPPDPDRRDESPSRSSIARRSLNSVTARLEALAGLNFDTRHGESLRLLGLNGASKTTSISILASEQRPSAGDTLLLSHSIRGERQEVRQMIGVAP